MCARPPACRKSLHTGRRALSLRGGGGRDKVHVACSAAASLLLYITIHLAPIPVFPSSHVGVGGELPADMTTSSHDRGGQVGAAVCTLQANNFVLRLPSSQNLFLLSTILPLCGYMLVKCLVVFLRPHPKACTRLIILGWRI